MLEIDLRALREQARDVFEAKWLSVYDFAKMVGRKRPNKENVKRNSYQWLAERINVKKSRMQFRYLTKSECVQVITICHEIAFADCERWLI